MRAGFGEVQYSQDTGAQQLLHLYDAEKDGGESRKPFLDEKEYACCGGGFPIRVEEVGVIGAILVSGLDHISDHDLIVKCVSRYLHIDEVPRIRGEIL